MRSTKQDRETNSADDRASAPYEERCEALHYIAA
eukprot:COSAG06_NODE_35931_length_453_cov_28.824859_1_plen_33_part_01